MGIRCLAITQPFFGQSGWHFYGNSGDYYLLISDEKSWFWCFFEKNNIFLAGKWALSPRWRRRVSRPDQKFNPPVRTFGSTVISKNFENFGANISNVYYRLTRCHVVTRVTPPQLFWSYLIPSRTPTSSTITWTLQWTLARSSLSVLLTPRIPFLDPSSTAWSSSMWAGEFNTAIVTMVTG